MALTTMKLTFSDMIQQLAIHWWRGLADCGAI